MKTWAIVTATAVLCALIVGPLSAAGGIWYGRGLGRALQAGDQAQQAVRQLNALIDTTGGLVARANTASAAMRRALGQRQQADNKTTQEMRDALATTASSRTGCVFGPDVMRQLGAARDRAADAAAGGIRNSVPSTATRASGQP